MAINKRECIRCGAIFDGGPRAWYCPRCRVDRIRERRVKYRKAPSKRKKGSVDHCLNCGKEYVVKSGNQKYCPDCAPIMMKAIARKQSLEYYYKNAEAINPKRNEKRRTLPTQEICAWCGKAFTKTKNSQTLCSSQCRYERGQYMARMVYDSRRRIKRREAKKKQ